MGNRLNSSPTPSRVFFNDPMMRSIVVMISRRNPILLRQEISSPTTSRFLRGCPADPRRFHRVLPIHPTHAALVRQVAADGDRGYFVSSANPRLVEGKPSKNPRYLQLRPDLVNPRDAYLAEVGARLRRRMPPQEPLYNPVAAVLPGRRNNPPEAQNPFAGRV